MYADGRGVPKDPAQAAIWLEKSKSSTGHNDATTREAAEKGSIDAQLALGMKYHTGITSPRDDMEALVWYRKAADQGNVQGQYYLAEMYANGWGTSKDADQAVALYRKAAEQGSADARSRLRAMYNDRKIVPLIDAQAGDWWRKLAEQAKAESLAFARAREAAEHGSAAAQVELGTLYLTGTGVTKDRDQAEIWFKKAAEQDYSEARCLTAAMVASDMGWKSDADNADAADRCQKAANDGGSDAQVILAVFYETGRGVPKDKSQADAWWTKAAEKGRADAQDRLGGAYMKGDGVLPADKILSIEWFARAAKQNDQQAMLQLSLQETVAKMRDEPFQLPDGLDGLTLSKLAVEYSPNKKRDFLPNLWASHANEFELQQESAKAGDAFKKAWEKMGIKDGSSFADFNPTTPVR
jgi:TPR repeat protein